MHNYHLLFLFHNLFNSLNIFTLPLSFCIMGSTSIMSTQNINFRYVAYKQQESAMWKRNALFNVTTRVHWFIILFYVRVLAYIPLSVPTNIV